MQFHCNSLVRVRVTVRIVDSICKVYYVLAKSGSSASCTLQLPPFAMLAYGIAMSCDLIRQWPGCLGCRLLMAANAKQNRRQGRSDWR